MALIIIIIIIEVESSAFEEFLGPISLNTDIDLIFIYDYLDPPMRDRRSFGGISRFRGQAQVVVVTRSPIISSTTT